MQCRILIDWDLSNRVLDLIDAWIDEHRGYYGTPHGRKVIPTPKGLLVPTCEEELHCGYYRDEEYHAWLRSSGNWAALYRAKDGSGRWELLIDSRRHGIPPGIHDLFAGLRWDGATTTWRDGRGWERARVLYLWTQADDWLDPLWPVQGAADDGQGSRRSPE